MKKIITGALICLLLQYPVARGENSGPDSAQLNEMSELQIKYPGKFSAFYNLDYKMTPGERQLLQNTINKLEAEKKFNDLMKEEKVLKEKLSKAGTMGYIKGRDGKWLTPLQYYTEQLTQARQKRIEAGVQYSVLKQKQAEAETKHYNNYQQLFQKEEDLRKKLSQASSRMTLIGPNGLMTSEARMIEEELEQVYEQRNEAAKKVALVTEDKYRVGGIKQLVAFPKYVRKDAVLEPALPETQDINQDTTLGHNWGTAEQSPVVTQDGKQGSISSQSWGTAEQSPAIPTASLQSWGDARQSQPDTSITGNEQSQNNESPSFVSGSRQSWGTAEQLPAADQGDNVLASRQGSSSEQSWGTANKTSTAPAQNNMAQVKEYTAAQNVQNTVTTPLSGSSQIIPRSLFELALQNAKVKDSSFGTSLGEYVSGIPERVLEEAYRMASVNGQDATIIDKFNQNLLKLIRQYGIPLNNVAIIQSEAVPASQPPPVDNNKKGKCFLPNGEFDSACFVRKIMPGIMSKVGEGLNNIPIKNPVLRF